VQTSPEFPRGSATAVLFSSSHTHSYGNKKTNLIYPFPHRAPPRVLFSAPSILHHRLLLVHIDFGPLKGTCVSEREREREARLCFPLGYVYALAAVPSPPPPLHYVKLALCAYISNARVCVQCAIPGPKGRAPRPENFPHPG
jgi:hypothetical protein